MVSVVGYPCIASRHSCLQVTYAFGYPYPSRMNGYCDLVLTYRWTWEKSVTSTQFSPVILLFMLVCACEITCICMAMYGSTFVCIILVLSRKIYYT